MIIISLFLCVLYDYSRVSQGPMIIISLFLCVLEKNILLYDYKTSLLFQRNWEFWNEKVGKSFQ